MRSVTTVESLRAILGEPKRAVLEKDRARLHAWDRAWLAQSPFCLLATANADGDCDVSPRGDPKGFVHVVDDCTLALPERPGNKRADSLRNILENPRVGLLFVIPGRDQTLRVNGRAELVTPHNDADASEDARDALFDQMVVSGHRPVLAILVHVEQVFSHCAKAFMRSQLWSPETWTPDALPSHARLVKETEARSETLDELEAYYGPSYRAGLYASPVRRS
jgi:hypothetical protein